MRKNNETIQNLNESHKDNKKNQIEKTKDSIKEILASPGEKIHLTDKEILSILKDPKNRLSVDIENTENYKQMTDVYFISRLMHILKRSEIKNFLKRKNKYLEEHRTISKKRFEELFGGSGKYGKTEINQKSLGLCYAYTGFELLKKTNGFDEIIQTNLIETENGWKVRLPFFNKYGEWVQVNKNEIDKEFYSKRGNRGTININSESKYLGFKILEIAFIKKEIIQRYKSQIGSGKTSKTLRNAYLKYSKTNDIPLNITLLNKVEGGNTLNMLQSIFPINTILVNYIPIGSNSKMKDFAFEHFSTGLYKISLGIDGKMDKNIFGSNIMKGLDKNGKLTSVALKDSKIIDNGKIETKSRYIESDDGVNLIQNPGFESDPKSQRAPDLILDQEGNKHALIYLNHSYSIEKCYIDKQTGEKRVWIVNPRHTGIKIDISLDECKKLFSREITGIDIDKMFR